MDDTKIDELEKEAFENDAEYPYTYAADFIRLILGYEASSLGTKLKISRSDAGRLIKHFAKAFGADRAALLTALAEYYRQNEKEIIKDAQAKYFQESFDGEVKS